jgi:phosphoribosylformylglycinamidine synthase
MWQFSEVVDGLTEACEVFETPITGGNVSFYNETFEADIYPTPVIGIVGIVEDLKLVTTSSFQKEGDRIVLIERASRSEDINLDEERALQKLIAALIRDGLIRSAHDLSEGGFAVALAESCFSTLHRGAIGAEVSVPSNMEVCRDLFAEFPSRVLISTSGDRLRLEYEGARAIDLLIDDLEQRWRDGLPEALENRPLLK